jgi:hypothetical protein
MSGVGVMAQTPSADPFLEQPYLRSKRVFVAFFFKAVDETARWGLLLEFGSFADLLNTNKSYPESWMRLTTTFREHPGGVTQETGLFYPRP